jgi:hypothetical protein
MCCYPEFPALWKFNYPLHMTDLTEIKLCRAQTHPEREPQVLGLIKTTPFEPVAEPGFE